MLFPLDLTTPECEVFKLLNNELLYFLEQSIHSTTFSDSLFRSYSPTKKSQCWLNKPTKEKFEAVWNELPSSVADRQVLFNGIHSAQDLSLFFNDPSANFPPISAKLSDALKELTKHLYEHTSALKPVEHQASQTVHEHYQAHIRANQNSHLCYVCGTACMSQSRYGLVDDDQWRADYDHLLNKADYPLYAVHPKNLMPTCHICNSKAKGKKKLIHDTEDNRRKAFYPFSVPRESCDQYVELSLVGNNLSDLSKPIDIEINWPNTTPDLNAKISAWEEVFQVPSRVKAKLTSGFIDHIASDLDSPQDAQNFDQALRRKVRISPTDLKQSEWRFWWHKLYQHLSSRPNNDDIWSMIDYKYGQITPSTFKI
jgi:hypothetical protein